MDLPMRVYGQPCVLKHPNLLFDNDPNDRGGPGLERQPHLEEMYARRCRPGERNGRISNREVRAVDTPYDLRHARFHGGAQYQPLHAGGHPWVQPDPGPCRRRQNGQFCACGCGRRDR